MIVPFYSCTAETKRGGRCPNLAEIEGRCWNHASAPRASWPDVVLVQLSINLRRSQRLEEIMRFPRVLGEQTREAASYKRPFGIWVFGPQPLARVLIEPSIEEMAHEGYSLEDPYLAPRARDGEMDILTLPFLRGTGKRRELSEEIAEIASFTWGYCKVRVNSPNQAGRVTHTVICAHRLADFPPVFSLHFNEGLWQAQDA